MHTGDDALLLLLMLPLLCRQVSTLPLLLLMVVRTCTGLGAQGDVWYLSLEGILMFPFLTLLIFLSGTPFLLR